MQSSAGSLSGNVTSKSSEKFSPHHRENKKSWPPVQPSTGCFALHCKQEDSKKLSFLGNKRLSNELQDFLIYCKLQKWHFLKAETRFRRHMVLPCWTGLLEFGTAINSTGAQHTQTNQMKKVPHWQSVWNVERSSYNYRQFGLACQEDAQHLEWPEEEELVSRCKTWEKI